MKSVCIIGGGASALMCACFASNNVKITVLEKADKIGKKILATGNGRCNLTNKYMNKSSYNFDINMFLQRFSNKDVISFFNKIGLEVYADDEGRVYPFSNSAVSVLDVLKNYLKQKDNVEIKTGVSFSKINLCKNRYQVLYDQTSQMFDGVVVATGNCTDLESLKSFNLETRPFMPSLCALDTQKHKNLAGVRVDNVKVICHEVGFEEIGEVLFKQDGISGIVIFNLSAYLARRQNYCSNVILDFMPNIDLDCLVKKLTLRKEIMGNYTIDDFLTGLFIKQLNYEFLTKLNLDVNKQVKTLKDKDIYNLAYLIKNYNIKTTSPQSNNQVFSGGVCLSSLDKNLQAKNQNGLYVIGEAVDVDGVCGGYNLQWAWTSGKIVGESL